MAKQRPQTETTAQEQAASTAVEQESIANTGETQATGDTEDQAFNTSNEADTSQQLNSSEETGTTTTDPVQESQEKPSSEEAVNNGVVETNKADNNTGNDVEQKPTEIVKAPEVVVTETQVAAAPVVVSINSTDVAIPADIADEVKPDMIKFLEHYSQTASPSSKAWARNILNTGIKFKRKRPIDMKGCLDCTMFALTSMQQSIAYAEEAQTRMRFIKACFVYVDNIFDLELIGRGANQLTEQQYKQYMALSNMFHYWATLNDGAEVLKRYNVTKELTAAFEPAFAQRAASIVGA